MLPYADIGVDPTKLTERVYGSSTKWLDDGSKAKSRFTHRVVFRGLKQNTRYFYSVGSDDLMSDIFNFMLPNPDRPLRMVVFGDLGKKGGVSIDPLVQATAAGEIDLVVHIGDFAYDLHDNDGDKGDDFMNEIEPIAAYVPYMTIAGNHEQHADFNHYINRFTMPQNELLNDNQFWSVDIGPYHLIGISTEYYNFDIPDQANLQYQWLQNDLRNKRNGADGYPALEDLFRQGGIDMVFWGHEHTFQRYHPIYKSKVFKQDDPNKFHNAPTTVYMLTGAAGCHDHEDQSTMIIQDFTAAAYGNWGYSNVTLSMDGLVSTFIDGNKTWIIDTFTLSKDAGYMPGRIPFGVDIPQHLASEVKTN